MSDYKRETYYLYNYENGRKRNNVGFARVEQMNGKCKITSRIRVPSMNGKLLDVCLFIRKQGELELLPIGKMQISNMTGELRSMLYSDNIMETGYCMEEIKGMIIYSSLEKFFGSEWDDHKIILKKLKFVSKKDTTEQRYFTNISNKTSETSKTSIKQIEERQGNRILQAASFIETDLQEEDSKEIEKEQNMSWENKTETYPQTKSKEKELEEMGKMTEILPETQIENNLEKDQKQEDQKQETKEQKEETQKKENDQKIPQTEKKEQNPQLIKMETNKPFSDNLPAIFYQFPQMYPFEDDEMTDCVRIEPQDIGRLPMESWILANNSFLLHSYYSYRHLLLARRKHGSSFEYVICAPGICQNREQFMAAMFGFSDFKPARNVEDKNGEFGYWYMPVLIGD